MTSAFWVTPSDGANALADQLAQTIEAAVAQAAVDHPIADDEGACVMVGHWQTSTGNDVIGLIACADEPICGLADYDFEPEAPTSQVADEGNDNDASEILFRLTDFERQMPVPDITAALLAAFHPSMASFIDDESIETFMGELMDEVREPLPPFTLLPGQPHQDLRASLEAWRDQQIEAVDGDIEDED